MAQTNEVLIRFVNLTKKFGNFTAVSNLNLEIHRGEVVGFLGPNGAGKSTTMKMMADLIEPTSGEIWIRGNGELQLLTSQNKDYLLDKMGFLIENPEFYPDVTPRHILGYFGKLRGYPRDKLPGRIEETVKMVGLSEWIDKNIGTFSKGMRQKVGLIATTIHDPDIIVLDEPHSGLDPKARKEVRDFIIMLKESGKTVFLSSHLLFEVSEVADRVAVISHGVIIACDTIENLEATAKRSAIKLEILNVPKENLKDMIKKIEMIVNPIRGLENNALVPIKYFPENHLFEIIFNGNPKTQSQILKALINAGIEVIGFSVPKANLLEDLYLDLIKQSEAAK